MSPKSIVCLLAWMLLPALAAAQNQATLELLVKRGVITQAEADATLKENAAALPVAPRNGRVRKLQILGMIQAQYDFLATTDNAAGASNPPSTNQFFIRRLYFGAYADLGNGWAGEIQMDFAATPASSTPAAPQSNGGNTVQSYFDTLFISQNVPDRGLAAVGFQKVHFSQDQTTSTPLLKAIERSLVTNYFTEAYGGPTTGRLGFGNRHVGAYWDGVVPAMPGLYYGLSVGNGIQSVTSYGYGGSGAPSYNQFSYWVSVGYQGQSGDFTYKAGLNLGYSGDGNDTPNLGPGFPAQSNAIWGYNPYITLTWRKLTVSAEFLQAWVQNGRSNFPGVGAAAPAPAGFQTSTAVPYGFMVQPSYAFTPEWEAVARFSYLGTNGRGTSISSVYRNAPNTTTPGFASNYNEAWAIYLGFNYYIIGSALRLAAGYEFSQFEDRQAGATSNFSGPRANVNAFRTQLQLQF